MRGGDPAGCDWPVDVAPLPPPAAEWGPPGWESPSRTAPPRISGQHSDSRGATAAKHGFLDSSRQPYPTLGLGGYDPGLGSRRHDPALGAGSYSYSLSPSLGGNHISRLQQPVREWGQPLHAPRSQERSRCVLGQPTPLSQRDISLSQYAADPRAAHQQVVVNADGGTSEEGRAANAPASGQRNLLTLRFKDADLESRFRARNAEASVSSDTFGDLFILCACLVTLVVRAKSRNEHVHVVLLSISIVAKMVLRARARARAAYLRHRVAIVIATRFFTLLTSSFVGSIQLARPRVYEISGSLLSLCGTLFINSRLVTLTFYPTIMQLPWASDVTTTAAGVMMIIMILTPHFCTPEHLSHGPTVKVMQYLATALDELCGGWLAHKPQEAYQEGLVVQCLQLHLCTQVFWGCLVPLTVSYILENCQRTAFAKQAAPAAATAQQQGSSFGSQVRYQGSELGAPSRNPPGSYGDRWHRGAHRGLPGAAPFTRRFAGGSSEVVDTAREPSAAELPGSFGGASAELPSPVAADLLVAAGVLPLLGAALWYAMRLGIGWHRSQLAQLVPT